MSKSRVNSKVSCLVVDSGPFIKGAALQDWSQTVYTIRDVISEIKDSETRQRLQVLPYELILKEPSQEYIKHVTDFSKKTGDYQSLSAVDLRLIALTYQLEKERGPQRGTNLRTDPIQTNKEQQRIPYSTAGFYTGKKPQKNEATLSDSLNDVDINKECDDTSTEQSISSKEDREKEREQDGDKDTALTNDILEEQLEEEEEEERGEEDGEGEDDDDSWITPDNYQSVCDSIGGLMEETIDEISVGCMTTDYAMQNVLLQIGLNVVSIDGMLIKRIRTYAQQCKACFKVYFKSGLLFCPYCGNKSMI
uniref:RNA-binding protein NOB1 n=1 Tax=Amphimedon queenslandica TaxID=400682 RepID=A0A1X7TKB4_AMPQE